MAVGAGTGLYTWLVEPFWLELVELTIRINNLPEHLKGKSLMQISDMHVGNRFDYQFVIDSFQEVGKLNPDFVVYTGDFVSYKDAEQFKQLKEVMQYAVLGNLGTIAILGNHDYGRNWSEERVATQVTDILQTANLEVLRNQTVNKHGLNFIGMDDYWGTNFNPEKALSTYQSNQANIVLCHNPDVCDLKIWNNYQGWILSGHTHGGQCKPPFLKAPMLPVKNKNYDQGIKDLNDGRQLYINRALGHLWQVRFNVRPEITLFTLE